MELKITEQDLQNGPLAAKLVDFIKSAAGLSCGGTCGGEPVTVGEPQPMAPPSPPAPSSAAAEVFKTAPEAPPASSTAVLAPPPPAPTPAPAAAAPMAPAAPTTPAPVEELDSKGLPWDARIHAQNRARVADGSWRKGRGVDAAVIAAVEAELRARVGQAAPAPIAPPPPPAAPLTGDFEADLRRATAAPLPPPPPAAVVAPLPSFSEVIVAITTAGLTEAEYLPSLQAIGAASVADLAAKPHLVPQALAALAAVTAARGA